MRIEQDDTRVEGGFARLVLPGQAQAADPGLRVSITNFAASMTCLGPAGWQAAGHRIRPRLIRVGETDLTLVLGPEVVDAIEPYTPVRITIPNLGIEETLSWPDLLPSQGYTPAPPTPPADDADVPILREGEDEAAQPAPPPDPPPPEPEPKPIPEPAPVADPVAEPPPSGPGEPVGPDAPADPAPVVPFPSNPPPEKAPEKEEDPHPFFTWRRVVPALAVVALVAVLAPFLWQSLPAPQDAEPEPGREAEPLSSVVSPLPPSALPSDSPDRQLAVATAALEAGDADQAIPTLRRLIREGHAAARLPLARHYATDNPAEALDLIREACAAATPGAAEVWADINQELQSRAARGDGQAQLDLEIAGEAAKAACQP